MEEKKVYELPALPYGFKDLAPIISQEQLMIHYQKHHQAYVNGANAILMKLDQARLSQTDLDMKATLKELSFNIGGHWLHSLFWKNLQPFKQGINLPGGALAVALSKEFGSLERLQKEFAQTAQSVEGSGWAALVFCKETNRLLLMQIEKHNVNIFPEFKIVLVLDVFEHAYYLDYKNDRAKYIENFWKIVNWDEVGKRLE